MLASVVQGLLKSMKSLGEAGGRKGDRQIQCTASGILRGDCTL